MFPVRAFAAAHRVQMDTLLIVQERLNVLLQVGLVMDGVMVKIKHLDMT